MRKLAMILAAGAVLATAGAADARRPRESGEEELARVLDGRVAGPPVNCISIFDSHDQRVIDKTAIVYGTGRTLYVNRPTNARDLDRDDVLVSDIHGSQVCSLDVVRLRDRSGGFYKGFVGLQQFIPYRRVGRTG